MVSIIPFIFTQIFYYSSSLVFFITFMTIYLIFISILCDPLKLFHGCFFIVVCLCLCIMYVNKYIYLFLLVLFWFLSLLLFTNSVLFIPIHFIYSIRSILCLFIYIFVFFFLLKKGNKIIVSH